jgi:hypothetical protein
MMKKIEELQEEIQESLRSLEETLEEFCRRHRISVQLFYEFKDEMPLTIRVGTRVLISKEAAAAWRREREAAA